MALWVNESFCWREWGWVAELLSETTALATKKSCYSVWGVGVGMEVKETSEGKWNKQKQGGQKRWKYFSFAPHSVYYILVLCIFGSALRALCSITGNTTAHPATAKQYPGNISSRQHLTDIKKLPGMARRRRAEQEGRWKCARLIVTMMKPFVKTAAWRETTNTK